MKKLYFVRHGLSDHNTAGLFSGQIEAMLTEDGRAQAKAAGKQLEEKHLHIDLIVCSPLQRAYETACIIAREIGYPIEQIVKNPLFKERSFGVLEGKATEGLLKDGNYKQIDSVEGAESIAELQARAEKALAYVQTLPDENILIVGHGASGRALRRAVNNEPHTDEYIGQLKFINNSEIVELF